MPCLSLIETSGNQAYIFGTNKLREQIGASELTYRVGTRWLREALGLNATDPVAWRSLLREKNGRLAGGVEIVVATSGKTILLCDSREQAEALISDITERALKEAPGLSVCGAIVDIASLMGQEASKAMKALHDRFNRHRQALGAQLTRLPMLPLAAPCATSGLPASHIGKGEPLSAASVAKVNVNQEWFTRVKTLLQAHGVATRLPYSLDELEKLFDESYLAVIQADGNGLGQIVLAFDQWLDADEDYFDALRAFSLELEEATEKAFLAGIQAAAKEAARGGITPIVPLLLGGDDVTVVAGANAALPFLTAFLSAFEQETAAGPTLARVAQKALGAPRLGISAGVAFVKSHFPFALAHQLAEALMQSAKSVKNKCRHPANGHPYPCSSFDFHVLMDASGSDLKTIRGRRTGSDGCRLWGGPYVTTPLEMLAALDNRAHDWVDRHHHTRLQRAIEAITPRLSAEEGLPRSQLHWLRETLSAGVAQAQETFTLIAKRYPQARELAFDGESLFDAADTVDTSDKPRTLLLDAMTLAGLGLKIPYNTAT